MWKAGVRRPPPVAVDDAADAPVRRDVNSDDVRRVHPDLPQNATARRAYLARCDAKAYEDSVLSQFPTFVPPATTEAFPCT